MFSGHNLYSPNSQQLIWCAEYVDGTSLCEFDLNTLKENDYKDIKQDKLLRFGLFGSGTKSYYEVYSGIFKVVGHMFQLSYVTDERQYDLMGQPQMYNRDVITFKDAEFIFDPAVLDSGINVIYQYNFGYKQKLHIGGINFNFKVICQLGANGTIYFNIWIVSDKDLNGRVVIRRNNTIVDEFDAPLKKGIGGEMTWQAR